MLRVLVLMILVTLTLQQREYLDDEDYYEVSGDVFGTDVDDDDSYFFNTTNMLRQMARGPCSENPCKSDQTCIQNGDGTSYCQSIVEFNGKQKSNNQHPCFPDPCPEHIQCRAKNNWKGRGDHICGSNCFASDPAYQCRNKGTCIGGHTCMCVGLFTGPYCTVRLYPCTTNPCVYGECMDRDSKIACICDSFYTGLYCDQPIVQPPKTRCNTNPCSNGGTCINYGSNYACKCASGFTGITCAVAVNSCHPNPCLNAGTCINHGSHHTCKCRAGYTGTNCDQLLLPDRCVPNPCLNGGTCINFESNHVCNCPSGFTGTTCEVYVNKCLPNPCINGGTCINHELYQVCDCKPGFTGTTCEMAVSRCWSNPCLNGGKCIDVGGDYKCICPLEYSTSKNCASVSRCIPDPCQNGGTCIDFVSYHHCVCPTGYDGNNCVNRNGCLPNPCFNGGTCIDRTYDYQCICPTGYTETKNCESVSRCIPNPCQNGGTCIDHMDDYRCKCPTGYTETKNCENRCTPNPCYNGGKCTDRRTFLTCECTVGYSGIDCRTQIAKCQPNPCQNGGTCTDEGYRYTCSCIDGYSGIDCRTRIEKCQPNPCQNGGTCTDEGYRYTCSCIDGHDGINCRTQNAVSKCQPDPCLNGGTCSEDEGYQYKCSCIDGFDGTECQEKQKQSADEDVCQPDPCEGDCVCQPSCRHSSGYYCESPTGYLGKNCSIPPPVVVCGNNAISISVNAAFAREYTSNVTKFKISVSPNATSVSQDCTAILLDEVYTISIPAPFGDCSNSVEKQPDGKTVVTNNVYMSLAAPSGFDMPVPIIHFKCVYEKQFTVTSYFQPTEELIYPTVQAVGYSSMSASMNLCKVDSCPAACDQMYGVTEGATYTVSEKIHLQISAGENVRNLAVHEMFLSCSKSTSTSITSAPVVLVINGCPASALVNYMPTTIGLNAFGSKACVSFQVAKLDACQQIYIHAKLRQCMRSQIGSCSTGGGNYCMTAKRRKRTVAEYQQVLGPIYFINQPRKPFTVVFPNETWANSTGKINDLDRFVRIFPDRSNAESPYISYIVYIAVTALVFLFTLLLLGFVIRKLCKLSL